MRVSLTIGGMTCPNCVRHVRQALQSVAGVESVEVDLASGRAEVTRAGNGLDLKTLVAAVDRAGYTAEEYRG